MLFEHFSQELDRRLPRSRFRLWMKSRFGCPVTDSSFASKAMFRVTVYVDLPVRLGELHFVSKCNHTFHWNHWVGIRRLRHLLTIYRGVSRGVAITSLESPSAASSTI
jgi:hypothetical protein